MEDGTKKPFGSFFFKDFGAVFVFFLAFVCFFSLMLFEILAFGCLFSLMFFEILFGLVFLFLFFIWWCFRLFADCFGDF